VLAEALVVTPTFGVVFTLQY